MTLRFYLNGSATAIKAEALGIASATLSLLSMAADQLRLSTTRSLGQAPLNYGDTLRLTRLDGNAETTLFIGKVAAIRAAADATRHAHDITLLGPWNDLEQIVYKQRAKLYDAAAGAFVTDYASRVILSGRGTTVAQMLEDVVAYAVTQGGAEMDETPTIENIAMALPRDEQEGLTCAGAIQRLLRFMPDAVAAFDYTQSPPKLTFRRSAKQTSLAGRKAAAVDLEALTDRAIDRVEIEVYKTHSIDGSDLLSIERLRYPADAATWAPGAAAKNTLSVPMEMDGRSVAYERARIESEKLPENLVGTPGSAAKRWLKNHIEDLTENIFDWPEDVTVAYETRRLMYFNDAGEAVYETKTDAAALAQFPRVALSTIPHWVDTTAEATLTITFPKKSETREIGGTSYDIGSTEDEVYTLRFVACSKESGNYRRIAEAQAAEVCPSSLPQALWNSWHNVFVEGAITLWLETGEALPRLGDAVTGYPGEPEDALSLVQGITVGDSGQVVLTLGPPEHLAPHDLVELLRGFRTRRPAFHASQQESGQDDTGLDTGSASAKITSGRSAALQTKAICYGADDKSKTATIDPDLIQGDKKAAALRQVTLLSYNATSKKLQPTKAYILATEPVTDGKELEVGAALPAKDFLVKGTAAALAITAASGSGSSATPAKLSLTLPIYNPDNPDADNLILEVDASALKGKDGQDGADGKDGTFDTGSALSVTVVTGVKYDTSTHKLTLTKRTIKFYGTSTGTESTETIAEATAHSSEHA